TTFESFAAYAQLLPANSFVQLQSGTDQPTETSKAPRSLFWRAALGKSFRQSGGLVRMWTHMTEFVATRDFTSHATTDWDIVLHAGRDAIQPKRDEPQFQTSDRCLACHNGLVTASGGDVSIGFHWRASMMANSSRDPYWQGSVRREVTDHPESKAHIEDECSICHMPITRYEAKLRGKEGEVFAHFPISTDDPEQRQAADGVSCSVCHQITREKFGTRNSFNGGFVVHG